MEMQMSGEFITAVVITGIVVVFLALVIMVFFFEVIGKIFGAVGSKIQIPETESEMPVLTDTPAESDDSEEVAAVIAAVMSVMSDTPDSKPGKPGKVGQLKQTRVKPAWGLAGMRESTSGFTGWRQ
ncbi:MAG: OadG family protein [Oscillospiraceae bacterium]|jgi:Na+-transporting methylmalonyl-CoA/oxaloacetate decarboxylase gamma subunit|nr:OadG family protein [Oscillospiraceae bacterium]